MKRELTYATVCSGIECMSVACRGLPMRPVFFSEIEPFPCAVLKAHYPDVPNLGDMSRIQVSNEGKEITNGSVRIVLDERIDILAGGTPCQDVSVAGKRAGMREGSGTRSSLAFDFVRLARELRPRWVLWENVAGSIDSKNAPDFLRFASALGDCGYSLAWRVLDAQYVRVDGMERAVPQRRRRVWVVGCLGADESRAAKILFEPDCVAGHTAPRRRAGEGFAYSLAGRDRVDAKVVGDATTRGFRSGSFGQFVNDETCGTLDCEHMNSAANGTPAFAVHDAIALDGDKLKPREDQRKGGNGFGINEEGAGSTLTGVDRHGVAYGVNNQGGAAPQFTNETSGTMVAASNSSGNNLHGVAYGIDQQGGKGGANTTEGVAPTVLSDSHGTPHGVAYCADGGNVAATITRQMSEQSGQDNRANAVVQIANGVSFDGRKDAPIADGVAHSQTIGTNPGFKDGVIISTNSNGEDVAATINANMSKLGGDNQTTFGGGTASPAARKERTMGIGRDVIECGKAAKFAPDIQDECSPTIRAKAPTNGVMIAKEGADGE